ncbi:MAG: hypothetical protein AAF296_11040 [Pseudomonadota bacterium]
MKGLTVFGRADRRRLAFAIALAGHFVVLGLALNLESEAPSRINRDPVSITILLEEDPTEIEEEIVEELDQPDIIEPIDEPNIETTPTSIITSDVIDLSGDVIDPPLDAEPIDDLSVPDETDAPRQQAIGQSAAQAPSETQRVSEILRRLDCASLTRGRDKDCPEVDPFTQAETDVLRSEQNTTGILAITDASAFGPQSGIEKWAAKNDGFKPTSLFGEDNSIFIDPMAEGAYNAGRIRNGDNPIWDRDIEKELRNARNPK